MDIRIFAILCIVTKSVSFLFAPVPRLALNNRLHSVPKGQEQEDSLTYFAPNSDINDLKSRHTSIGNDDELESDSIDLSTNEYSFFDEAIIFVRAGSGGQGSSTYKKGVGGQQGPPDGGDGGRGGNVILLLDESLNTLAGLTQGWRPNSFGGSGANKNQELAVRPKSFRAESGSDGDRRLKNGAWGQDVIIRVPPGTMIQEEIDIISEEGNVCSVNHITIGSINMETPRLIVALGGDGGEGSGVAGKFYGRGVKRLRNPPVRGERKRLKLILKIVADVALVGVPNAGKSTFLASVTRAKPKIANVSQKIGVLSLSHSHF
jgi:GTPase